MARDVSGEPGRIVTFYSYKGGVGRSFALANVAALLARWQFKVLCIDWDIEAPGLDHYLGTARDEPGLVDMLSQWRGEPLPWRALVRETPDLGGASLSLIGAGRQDGGYTRLAQALDWSSLYGRGLGEALEAMAAEMREDYDVVLIDSRTGITDFAAIVTAQLPDILVFMFTANNQSLDGCVDVARRAAEVRGSMPIERGALRLVPVPARFEGRVEYSTSQEWRERFYERLEPFYASWLVRGVDHRRIVDETTIPHVPFWTFGERLAVVQEAAGGFAPDSISRSIETISALIAKDLATTEVLADSRDAYVASVQRREARRRDGVLNAFLSFSHEDVLIADQLSAALSARGISLVRPDAHLSAGVELARRLDLINRAQHILVLVGREWGRWQEAEVRAFQSQSALDERPRLLVPILVEHGVQLPRPLLSYRTIDLSEGVDRAAGAVEAMIGEGPAMA